MLAMSIDGGNDSRELSASAIVAPVIASGSHILRIEGYSATKGFDNGFSIASEKFVVGGHRWRLRYCPESLDYGELSDSISFALVNDDDTGDVQAKFAISLLDQAGKTVTSYTRTSQSKIFGRYYSSSLELINRSELEGSAYLKDDAFTVRCDVMLVKKVFTKTVPVSEALRGVVKRER